TGEELQAARQEVLRAERLAAIGGLAPGVAPRLGNPLPSGKLLLEHSAARRGGAENTAPKKGPLPHGSGGGGANIQVLRALSRPAEPQRKLHDLRETIERALHLVAGRAEKQHVATAMDLGDDALVINGDPQQLHQVFVNLLINAIEAMPQGGALGIFLDPHNP